MAYDNKYICCKTIISIQKQTNHQKAQTSSYPLTVPEVASADPVM